MMRRFFTILSALSLLLLVAVCVLWVRSYFVADTIMWRRVQWNDASVRFNDWIVRTIDGHLVAFVGNMPPIPLAQLTSQSAGRSLDDAAGFWYWPNKPENYPPPGDYHFGLPLWSLLPVCLLVPAVLLHQYRRIAIAKRRSLCPSGGYDLRATPGRCPECGTTSLHAATIAEKARAS